MMRGVANPWKEYMDATREVARRAAAMDLLEITQKGKVVDPLSFKGPIRLRRKRGGAPLDERSRRECVSRWQRERDAKGARGCPRREEPKVDSAPASKRRKTEDEVTLGDG
tara:strand:- start:24 stop:356 length:333 start_codon:yes stop_codon:yes gene_type:complete|mmetsp:Transcript_3974/g.16188  ORF Transcript_3974/g.16188 Transcript_3974/m.16188 type:complete len:111 (+) Transcript_3974:848-1180(+)